jgi:hypothetical protein
MLAWQRTAVPQLAVPQGKAVAAEGEDPP